MVSAVFYQAKLTRENDYWLAEFPDCPGCQTFSTSEEGLLAMAKEALVGWLEVSLEYGDVPSAPRIRRGQNLMRVDLPTALALRLRLSIARQAAGLTREELAHRAGITLRQLAKLERSGATASVATLAKVADALGLVVDLRLEGAA